MAIDMRRILNPDLLIDDRATQVKTAAFVN